MRCEQVQEELAHESINPVALEAVTHHVANCDACRQVQLFYARMDEVLKQQPMWNPPKRFVNDVVSHAVSQLQEPGEPPRIEFWNIVDRTVVSFAGIAMAYL